ncbi:receptor-like serine/threonine-protein kinase At4g25390 [Cannabis sativa]|uniref:receptor-like serine/threonine-protein kinase At4g25390 n=1 Tax=Cannabis sativa TaxID=3483 RepID=UPI0029CA36F5|nr:receptor-like serine/threonine-protein kinase At4g25390 [Cannabis sativa]
MPSRFIIPTVPSPAPVPAPTPSTSAKPHNHNIPLLPPLTAFSFLFFFLIICCFRKKRIESPKPPPHSLPYSVLRRATDSFAASRRLGQGGFGPVFHGKLPKTNQEIAVKVMDSGSLQGEREFQNELFFAASMMMKLDDSKRHVVSVLGFSSDRKRRRMLLVYDFMENGNLQEALLHKKCPELMKWSNRFRVSIDIAKGLEFLHHGLDQPIIHGDIKPSNILLDKGFNAKIGDFGLARLKKLDSQTELVVVDGFNGVKKTNCSDDYGEIESVTTGFEDSNVTPFDFSPDVCVKVESFSPEPVVVMEMESPVVAVEAESSPELVQKLSPLNVKEYVMEWIGSEINNERPKIGTMAGSSSFDPVEKTTEEMKKKKKRSSRKQLDWWISMDEEKSAKMLKKKKEKRLRPGREWWKEEYCEELAKKKKKRMKQQQKEKTDNGDNGDDWWLDDEELYKSRRKRNKGSLDWWLDGLSGELRRGWRSGSHDSGSSEIPKSGGYSSTTTPSMRGTVCYVAPETGFGGNPSEKCDVYSFGVTLLVLIAGRRPLQVTDSPMSEYQRANLLSWARHLARAGKLIDLVDKSIQCLDKEQALLCINVALLCLQKIPARRPSMKEVVGMLTGELELPQLPDDLSPSPPPQSRFPYKSHKKVW